MTNALRMTSLLQPPRTGYSRLLQPLSRIHAHFLLKYPVQMANAEVDVISHLRDGTGGIQIREHPAL
ncbi:hypothetical protein [Raoultella terrigena]|uniref:hypothetical protein n=1 Tax=Raoultella terrigena TaxID=577 RepID=UPI001F187EA4|nr:hypothetical protein [Raoultella terrigena]